MNGPNDWKFDLVKATGCKKSLSLEAENGTNEGLSSGFVDTQVGDTWIRASKTSGSMTRKLVTRKFVTRAPVTRRKVSRKLATHDLIVYKILTHESVKRNVCDTQSGDTRDSRRGKGVVGGGG